MKTAYLIWMERIQQCKHPGNELMIERCLRYPREVKDGVKAETLKVIRKEII